MSDQVVTSKQFDDFSVKLFKYLDARFEEVDRKIEGLGTHTDSLHGPVDTYSKEVEIYQQESLARDAQVNRLQRWIEQIAEQTGVKLVR